MANATATQLQQLYVAYFGRAADPSGLDYWVGQGTTTKAFAASMYAQDEFESVNGSLSIELQVNQIYQNLFGRDGDSDGLIYWSNQIRTGALELASIANDLIFAVNNGSSETDKAALTNKTNAAIAYTADIRESASALLAYQPKSSSPWVTGDNFATAVTFLKTATSTNAPTAAEVQASVDVISGNQSNGTTESKTLTLTTGVDETTSGTYSKFDGSLTASGTQTLNSLDSLEGTTGTSDVLNATITSSVTPSKLSGIEAVNITAGGATAVSVGLYNATGITSFASVGTTNGDSFTVNDADHTSITSFSISDSSVDHTFNFKDTSSKTDSVAFSLSNYTGGAATELTIPGVETLTITSAGGTNSNVFDLIAAAAKTLTIKGTGGFDIDATTLAVAGSTKITTIDASAASGNVAIATGALASGTTDITITGGSGNDTLDASAHVANDSSVSGGAGNDTIVVALSVDDTVDGGTGTDMLSTTTVITEAGNITNFETLRLTANVSQDMDFLSGNTITKVVSGNSGAGVGFTDASADVVTLALNASATGTTTFDRKTDTSTDSLTIDVNTSATTTAVSVVDEETITVENSEGAAIITTLTATDITKLSVTGSYDTTITNVAGVNLATVDASAATGAVTIGTGGSNTSAVATTATAGSGGLSFLSGSGADSLTGASGADSLSGAGGADSIIGGAGNDSLVGGAGNDTLSGGTGEDTITPGANVDSVTGGAGNDTIVMAANYTTDDVIDAGEGTDTLTMTGPGAATIKPTFTNVESVTFTAAAGGTNVLDLASTTGVSTVTIADGQDVAVTVNSIETGAKVVISEAADVLQTLDTVADATLTVDFKTTTADAANDTSGIAITDASTVNIVGKAATGDLVALALDAVDTTTLNLSATSTNDLHVGAITGTDQLTTLTLTSAAHTGTVAANTLADADSLTSLTITGVGGDITFDGAFAGTGSAENLATITVAATEGSDVDMVGAITLDNVDSTTDLATTITSSANGSATGGDASSVSFGAITSTYGSITATTSGDGLTTFDAITAKGITVTGSGSGGTTLTAITDTGSFNATFTGSGTNTVTTSTATTSTSIDGSGATGDNTFVSTATSNLTITGGSGADTITGSGTTASGKVHSLVGGAGNDTILGGAGADTILGGDGLDSITGGAGNDSLSGGAGNDTFVFADDALTANDTVDGGEGTDSANITTDTSLTGTNAPTLTNIEKVDIELKAASLSVDASGLTSLTELTLGADGNRTGLAVNNLATGIDVIIDDPSVDGLTLDTVASASITAKVQETMTGSTLTITDAASVTITNGSATAGDTTATVLDNTDTTSLTVTGGLLAGALDVGNITNTDKVTSITASSSTTSSTVLLGTVADADSLTSLTVEAVNANVTTGAIGATGTAEALAAVTVSATGTGVIASLGNITADTTDSSTDNDLVLTSTAGVGAAIDYDTINNQYGSFTETAVSDTTLDIDHDATITAVNMTITTSGGGHHDYEGKLDASGAVAITSTGSGNVHFDDIDADGTNASVSVDASALTGELAAVASNTTVVATITGGSGDDTITGGTKADTLTGNAGADSITGNDGNDTISGGAGNDVLKGNAGSDSITGGDGNDSITAGTGFDTIDAGAGDDTIIFGSNVSVSDSVIGGEGNDTVTATIDDGTANQKIGTLTGVENATLDFNQTGGSFDASGSLTSITTTVAEASDTLSITNLTSSQTVKITDGALDYGNTSLDYANDATANVEIGDSATVGLGTLTFTDAQTVNVVAKGGTDSAFGVTTFDATADSTGAGGTDTISISSSVAGSGITQTGNFVTAEAESITVTTADTNAHITLGNFTNVADLNTLTLTAGGGGDTANDSDITIGTLATGDEVETITVTAADGADVTIGASTLTGSTSTTYTFNANTTGSVITVGAIGNTTGSLTQLTASAVSGATVDFDDTNIATIGTMTFSGAGTITFDGTDSDITTLERVSAGDTSGTFTFNSTSTVGNVDYTLGTGTNTLTLGVGNDTVNLASSDGTDQINNKTGAAGQSTTIYNFQAGTASEDIGLDLSGTLASGPTAITALNTLDDGTHDIAANDAMVFYTPGAATGSAVDLANATTSSTIYQLSDNLTGTVVAGLQSGGQYETKADSAFTAGDGILVLWSDGTDSYLSAVEFGADVADNGTFASLSSSDLFVFKGVTDADNFLITQFDNIVT